MTEGCTDIKPLPGYSFVDFPYCITRTQFSINLLNLRRREVYTLFLDRKPDFDNEFMGIAKEGVETHIIYSTKTKEENCDVIR